MSHYCVLVIGENPEEQLAPFDENLDVPRYVKLTKEQVISKGRKDIEDYKNGTYAKYLENPKEYKESCSNKGHIEYLEEEFPKKLAWSDEEIYQDEIQYEDEADIGEDGEVYSTYNPKSKWDWYQLGGRYSGRIILKDNATGTLGDLTLLASDDYKKEHEQWKHTGAKVDQAYKRDIDFEKMLQDRIYTAKEEYAKFKKELLLAKTDEERINICFWNNIKLDTTEEQFLDSVTAFSSFAVLKDGVWYERGGMGWWGVVSNEKDVKEWQSEFDKLLKSLPDDTLLSIYDCHI